MKAIHIIGLGPGDARLLIGQATAALRKAELVIGAQSILSRLPDYCQADKQAALLPEEIAALVESSEAQSICIVFSGDIGLHSGASKLYPLLAAYQPICVNGISSLQYLCAQLGTAWQDVKVVSGHGRDCDPFREVYNHRRVFFLTDKHCHPGYICRQLCDWGLGQVQITVGENLALADERISSAAAAEFCGSSFADLNVVLAENTVGTAPWLAGPGLADSAFLRGEVPMTKSALRAQIPAKLRLQPQDTVFDIGAGTGSVAVELALSLPRGRVYAIEHKQEACRLIEQNKQRFGCHNLRLQVGSAPEALSGLPAADAAFIGGSDGKLSEIIDHLCHTNPSVRLAISAVTLETLQAALEQLQLRGFRDIDIVQISANQARKVGRSHMMIAHNPVYLVSGEGLGDADRP